ncbi:MAG: nitrous oxide-stimulated promoter family protein [Candidatus Latescibacter sp.]|nr:nitrous oxide-stimulated promoter family protein [Candidatus Latescibacter sp.]
MISTGKEEKNSKLYQHEILNRFIRVYCSAHHGTKEDELCEECADLSNYAKERLSRCPYDPKPACKKCRTHCYKPAYRAKIREVMRFSGLYFIKRGRLDMFIKYFL